jgi:hypothetical protein
MSPRRRFAEVELDLEVVVVGQEFRLDRRLPALGPSASWCT